MVVRNPLPLREILATPLYDSLCRRIFRNRVWRSSWSGRLSAGSAILLYPPGPEEGPSERWSPLAVCLRPADRLWGGCSSRCPPRSPTPAFLSAKFAAMTTKIGRNEPESMEKTDRNEPDSMERNFETYCDRQYSSKIRWLYFSYYMIMAIIGLELDNGGPSMRLTGAILKWRYKSSLIMVAVFFKMSIVYRRQFLNQRKISGFFTFLSANQSYCPSHASLPGQGWNRLKFTGTFPIMSFEFSQSYRYWYTLVIRKPA